MNTKKLMPITNTKTLVEKDGTIVTPVYATGMPRQYRLNLSGQSGQLNLNGEKNITKPGEAFKVIPIAYRIFEDALFDRPRMTWAEIYFINELHQIGMFMLNRYSAENFRHTLTEATFYEGKDLGELLFSVRLDKKEGQQGKYYMAFFDAEPIPAEEAQILKSAIEPIAPFYRKETITGNAEEIQSLNWESPFAMEEKELQEGEAAQSIEPTTEKAA